MSKSKQFQIYGRTEYEKPLKFIEAITAEEATVAEEALAAVGGDSWVELIVLPSDALLHVTGEPSNG